MSTAKERKAASPSMRRVPPPRISKPAVWPVRLPVRVRVCPAGIWKRVGSIGVVWIQRASRERGRGEQAEGDVVGEGAGAVDGELAKLFAVDEADGAHAEGGVAAEGEGVGDLDAVRGVDGAGEGDAVREGEETAAGGGRPRAAVEDAFVGERERARAVDRAAEDDAAVDAEGGVIGEGDAGGLAAKTRELTVASASRVTAAVRRTLAGTSSGVAGSAGANSVTGSSGRRPTSSAGWSGSPTRRK